MTTIHFRNGDEVYIDERISGFSLNDGTTSTITTPDGHKITLKFNDVLYVDYANNTEEPSVKYGG